MKRYNSDLANDLGNLVGRVTTLIGRHFGGTIPESSEPSERETELRNASEALSKVIPDHISSMRLSEAVEETMQLVRAINRYMERTEPWKLVKSDLERAGTVLYTAAESLRQALVMLRPIMPARTEKVLRMIGVEADTARKPLEKGLPLGDFEIPFPKIELPEADEEQSETEESNMSDGKISIEDFAKVDLRTAVVTAAEKVEGADKLLKLQIRVGEEERQIVAGIAEHYSPEELVGKTIAIVANLKPAVIRGVESNGMLLAASGDDSVVVVTVEDPEVGSGVRIS